jgi:uncharacterized OsmC-like protein
VKASGDRLSATAVGEVELEGKVLVLKRIRVRYRLVIPEDQREVAERVHAVHADHCPVYRSITPSVDIATELEMLSPS